MAGLSMKGNDAKHVAIAAYFQNIGYSFDEYHDEQRQASADGQAYPMLTEAEWNEGQEYEDQDFIIEVLARWIERRKR